jgi:hypothetical protein
MDPILLRVNQKSANRIQSGEVSLRVEPEADPSIPAALSWGRLRNKKPQALMRCGSPGFEKLIVSA